MSETLRIADLHVSVEGKPILKGIHLEIGRGEVHARMGPNGAGIHVIVDGRIVQTGGPEPAADLHQHGYDQLRALEAFP
jgi:Fe-S cluster assembly ATPase SufC